MDARYAGQGFELSIRHDPGAEAVSRHFHAAHRARYGYDVPGERIELVNARLTAFGALPHGADTANRPHEGAVRVPEATALRHVWHTDRFVVTPVFARDQLTAGDAIRGPAIVEQYDTCTYLAPNWRLTVRDDLLVLDRETSEA